MTGQTSAGRLGSQKQAGRRRGEAGAGPQGSASGEPASRRPAERLRGRGAPRGHDADCKRGSAVVSSHQSCGPDAHGHLAFRCLLAGRRLPRACDGAKLGRGEAVAPTVADRHRRAGRLTAEMGDGPPALGRAAAAERHVVLGGSLGGRAPRLVRSHSRSLTAHPLRACPVCGRVMTSSRTVPSTARHPAPRDTHGPRPTDQADDAHRACVRAPLGPTQTQPERPPAVPCPRLPPRQTRQ